MTPERNAQLDRTLMKMAFELSEMSLATRAKVGALIYKNNKIISMGWNGMPSGFNNQELEYEVEGKLVTNPLVLHGESNAIMKCSREGGEGTFESTLYVTMSPCFDCCKQIIQSGIKRVVYSDKYRVTDGLAILEQAGIKVDRISK